MFVVGGYKDAIPNSTSTSAIYTPSSGVWTSKASLVNARGRHAATLLSTGEVVVTGGISGSTTVQAVEVYRPTGGSANTWFAASSPAAAQRASHSSVRMQNGDVMIIGGRNGSTTLSSAWSYHFSSNTWTARGNLSEPRVGHTATVLSDGRILVTGGGPYNSTTVVASCDLYSPSSNAWKPTADMISARSGHTASRGAADDRVLITGGIGPGSSALASKTAERFNPSFETWTDEAPLNAARAFHTATVTLTLGTVIVAGGITKTSSPTYLTSAEQMTPVSNLAFASDYYDGTHLQWGPSDLPEVVPANDPKVDTRWTELKGTMYYPTIGAGAYPVVIMLHGSHESCGTGSNPHIDDSNTYAGNYSPPDPGGYCPPGYSEARSDKGFAYVAYELAQRGYLVFSIDANKGIANRNDGFGGTQQAGGGTLIDVRARLVLKTLQHISQWNAGTRPTPAGLPDLTGHVNLGNVGFVGHSRGGEAVRAASAYYRDDPAWQSAIPNLSIRGIFEIGSTDLVIGQSQVDYDTLNIPWALLMGTCDSNDRYSSEAGLGSGVRTFDRYITNASGFAGQYFVWGANHNFYNSEWQTTDVSAADCKPGPIYEEGGAGTGVTGSVRQRQTAVYTILHFMQAFVGGFDPSQLSIFDPAIPAPPAIKVSRAHQMSEGFVFDQSASGTVLMTGLRMKRD